jgi:hypothetical protein
MTTLCLPSCSPLTNHDHLRRCLPCPHQLGFPAENCHLHAHKIELLLQSQEPTKFVKEKSKNLHSKP